MTETTFKIADQEFDPEIAVDRIAEHPENYNEGDTGAISESMDEHGMYGAVLVQKSTGFILVGNHRYRAAKAKGAASVPGFWLDVDDDEAKRIMMVDNRTARLSTFNEHQLVALLTDAASSARGLAGTGYDGDDLDDLMAALNQPYVPDDPGSDGGYAEDPEEMAKRKDAVDNYVDRKGGGALVEMILVFTVDQRAEVAELLDRAREVKQEPDARAAELVLEALRAWQPSS